MGEDLTGDEIRTGLRSGVLNAELIPVLVGCATKNIGIHTMLDMIIDYMPNPSDLNQIYYPNIVIKQTSNTNCKVDNIKHKTEIIKSKILNKQLNDNNDNDTSKTDSDIDYKEESLSEAFCSSVDDY
jgi:translation elongation factor EF-G